MKLLKDVVFKTDFTEEYFQNEIEKFINELKRINEPESLFFEGINNSTKENDIYDSTKKMIKYKSDDYIGSYKTFTIKVNGNIKGNLVCFKSIDNKFFVIYSSQTDTTNHQNHR